MRIGEYIVKFRYHHHTLKGFDSHFIILWKTADHNRLWCRKFIAIGVIYKR